MVRALCGIRVALDDARQGRRGEWLGPPVALCDGGDGHARGQLRHLQPYVIDAATICDRGCNHI